MDTGYLDCGYREPARELIASMRPTTFFLSLVALAALPRVASAAQIPNTWAGLVTVLVSLMDSAILTLVAVAVAAYFYGLSSNIIKFGEEHDVEKRKAYFFWGIVILFVMVSVWGILRLVRYTVFLY